MMSHVLQGACEGLGRITKILKATNASEKSMDIRVRRQPPAPEC